MADLLYRITSDCATVLNEEPESEPVIANCTRTFLGYVTEEEQLTQMKSSSPIG